MTKELHTYTISTTSGRKFQVDAENEDSVEILANNLIEGMESILMIQKKPV